MKPEPILEMMVESDSLPFLFREARIPLLLSLPHEGIEIPPAIGKTMTESGRTSWDTDWFLDRLYDVEEWKDAGRLAGRYSRYVIDLNRPAEDVSLYPGKNTTGLIPRNRFDGQPIYLAGKEPDEAERDRRIRDFWQPYHDRLRTELIRMRTQFGFAVLLEGHSIASRVPLLFDGTLPDFNWGTHRGRACDVTLADAIRRSVETMKEFSHVFDGRFVGGYITRHYGNPDERIHAVQLELSQTTYLEEATKRWAPDMVIRTQPALRSFLRAILQWIDNQ